MQHLFTLPTPVSTAYQNITMINQQMQYGVGEASKVFEVDRDTIKSWAYNFSEFLTKDANPGRGIPRYFSIDDMRVFALVSGYWETDPDIEHIKICLRSGNHHDNDLIDNLIFQITPLFRDMPEDIDENYRGVVFGGEYCLGDLFDQADSFKLAGDRLVDITYNNNEERELFQPAIYNYRHATELYIKAVTGERKTHNLNLLLQKFKHAVATDFKSGIPEWFSDTVLAFHETDPSGVTFRYGTELPRCEVYCDLRHVKKRMAWLSTVFRRIRVEKEKWKFSS